MLKGKLFVAALFSHERTDVVYAAWLKFCIVEVIVVICVMNGETMKPLVEAAFGRKPSRQPIWFLRQAGRYLPEYREVRKNVEFIELCRSPKLAAEVTLQPLRRYDLDAAIIFSDILIPPTAMGQNLTFGKGHGPLMAPPVRTMADLQNLRHPDVEKELGYVGEAISLTKEGLTPSQTMIGFAGAPFTVASYMIEGQGSKVYTELKKLVYTNPAVFTGVLELLGRVTLDYLMMQVKAGADALMLFDTWVGNITCDQYRKFVKPVMLELVKQLKKEHPNIPLTYYPGQGTEIYHELSELDMDVVAVDWRVPLDRAIELLGNLGHHVSVQGNLDPQAFLGSEAVLRAEVASVLEKAKKARGHIFNVGHGLLPHLDPEQLNIAIDEVRNHLD